MNLPLLRKISRIFETVIGLALLGGGSYVIADIIRHPGLYPRIEQAFSSPTRAAFSLGLFLFIAGISLLIDAGIAWLSDSRRADAMAARPALNAKDWLPRRSPFDHIKIVIGTLWSMLVGGVIWFCKAMIED